MLSFKETGVKENTRLGPDTRFKFSCHKGLSCFTRCCADVNILLTPYDVLCMKKALNISSEEFLEKYTLPPVIADKKMPLVLLKMSDDDRKSCPFVTPEGCSIYESRPWSCRMFPLDVTSTQGADNTENMDFCFISGEGLSCQGLSQDKEWTVSDWCQDQGIELYDKKNQPFKEITLHKLFRENEKELEPAKVGMFYLACYDLDRFRRLLFHSSFLIRFSIDEKTLEKIKADDEELLDFSYEWLKFSLFRENTVKLKAQVP
jgi:Fe-S-cluster containining protein